MIYLLAFLFAFASPISSAQSSGSVELELAGRIIAVSGNAIARDQQGDRQLSRREEIFVGDTLFTDIQSSLQIRMVDGALISLQESTEFAILAYQYEEDISSDQSTLRLIQGGFRTITGSIGQQNREAYEAQISDFATIGIRGTDFSAVITPNGAFTAVYDGGTTVSNLAGELDLGLEADYDFAQIATPNSPPIGLLVQPPGLGNIPFSVPAEEDEDSDTGEEESSDEDNTAANNAGGNNNAARDDTSPPAEVAQNAASLNTNSNGNSQNSNAGGLDNPTAAVAAAANQASTANGVITGSQEDTVSALVVNPSEADARGAVSCATDSSLCLQLLNGEVIGESENEEETGSTEPEPPSDSTDDSSPADSSGGSDDDTQTTVVVTTNDDGSSTTTTTVITTNDDEEANDSSGNNGNGNSGNNGNGNSGNNGNGNSGNNGNGNSGNNGNGNSGNSGNGNSGNNGNGNGNNTGDDDSANDATDSTNDNSNSNSGNNGNGNSGNNGNGNGNNAGDDDSANDATDSTDDNSNGNSGNNSNGNSGNNGNGNSGNSGNGNNASDSNATATTVVVTTNDDGTTATTTTTISNDGETTTTIITATTGGNGNSGNNGNGNSGNNGNGNSGNNGNGNSGSNSQTLQKPALTVDAQNISWGRWNDNADDNFVVISRIDDDLVFVSTSEYLAQVNPAPIGQLTGSHNYATTIASSFIGSGSAGNISSLVAGMSVDFDTGIINQGTLDLLVADQVWSIGFAGSVNNGIVDLIAGNGQLLDSTGIISNSIDANLDGAFAGETGSAFVGGFDLIDEINTFNTVNGLFTIER